MNSDIFRIKKITDTLSCEPLVRLKYYFFNRVKKLSLTKIVFIFDNQSGYQERLLAT